MFSESRFEQQERPFDSLPPELADRLFSNSFTRDAEVFIDTYGDTLYRIFEGGEEYSGIPQVGLALDFREKKHDDEFGESLNQLRFEYFNFSSGEDVWEDCIAQMHFDMTDRAHFHLVHRYVSLDKRRAGVTLGTRLYSVAEKYFSQISSRIRKPVFLDLEAGQRSVITWAEKMGFCVVERDKALRREIDEHPERFFEDEVIVSEESQSQGIVKDRYTFRVGITGRYKEDAIRLTFKKRITPDADNSLVSAPLDS